MLLISATQHIKAHSQAPMTCYMLHVFMDAFDCVYGPVILQISKIGCSIVNIMFGFGHVHIKFNLCGNCFQEKHRAWCESGLWEKHSCADWILTFTCVSKNFKQAFICNHHVSSPCCDMKYKLRLTDSWQVQCKVHQMSLTKPH